MRYVPEHPRVPIWKVPPEPKTRVVRWLLTKRDGFWKSRITGAALIALAFGFALYWYWNIPSPGFAVAALAVVAAVMTFRIDMTGIEKVGWMLSLFALLWIETSAIKKDRQESNEAQLHAREALDRNFATVLKGERDSFTKTMGKMTGLANIAARNLCEVNGCDSFCYLEIDSDKTPVVIHSGDYTLYDVNVRIVDLRRFNAPDASADERRGTIINPGDLLANRTWSIPGSRVPFSDENKQDFNVFLTARNGAWVEMLRMRKISGVWKNAIRVEEDTLFGKLKHKARRRLEQIDPTFPLEDLEADVSWTPKDSDKRRAGK